MPTRGDYAASGIPSIASDGAIRQERLIEAPIGGLLEGTDPGSVDFPEDKAPVLSNIRVSRKTWLTRLGETAQFGALPGTIPPRFLDFLYKSDGSFTWLSAMGPGATAALYEIKVGTDTGWVASSGGTGLGGTAQPYFQGTTLADQFYLTDRQNTLHKYSPTNSPNHLISLSLPTAPAASPVVIPRPFGIMENYNTAWGADSPGNFNQLVDTTSNPPPDGSVSSHLNDVNAAALGHYVNSTDFLFPSQWGTYVGGISHSIAFWVKQDQNAITQKVRMQFQYGVNTPTDYSVSMFSDAENVNVWYPFFVPIGDLNALNFMRVLVQNTQGGGSDWMSSVYLPGTLEGPYRWVYTYYDSNGVRESAPSAITNNGQPVDFSVEGISFDQTTAGAFSKSALIIPAISADSTVTTIRIYRNGGVPSLTLDSNGLPLWLFVDSVPNYSSTTVGASAVGDTSTGLTSVVGLAVGNWLVFEPGATGKQEALQIRNISGNTVTLTGGLNYATTTNNPDGFQFSHSSGVSVRACYVDNTPNETIQLLNTLDVPLLTSESSRSAPPAGARYVQRSPEGRLWLFNYAGHPNGIAVSNLATPFRPKDYETFTSGVDPLTRGSPTMGWNFDIFRDVAQDEEIEWGGFFQGWATIITRNNIYRCTAHSQTEWGPTSVQKTAAVGCLQNGGDTVKEINGILYWVAPGPKVMAWDGSSDPQDISWLRCSPRLTSAPASKWNQWFATTHRRLEGRYYCLYFASATAGANGGDQRLDYNIDLDAWEPCTYNPMGEGVSQNFCGAFATDVPLKSIAGLYQLDASGVVYQAESGNLDGSAPIQINFSTPAYALVIVHQIWFRHLDESLLTNVKIRLAATTDNVTLSANTARSEYPPTSHSYALNLLGFNPNVQNSQPNYLPGVQLELSQRLDRDLLGRAGQLSISGSVFNRPEFELLTLTYIPLLHNRHSG